MRGDYKASDYGKVILPFVVLRRLDCLLEPTKPAVLAQLAKLPASADSAMRGMLLNRAAGPPSEAEIAFVRPLVEKASLALCINEAWAMLAAVALIALVLVPFARDAKARCD